MQLESMVNETKIIFLANIYDHSRFVFTNRMRAKELKRCLSSQSQNLFRLG
jgi:hypothetical protein